MGSASSRTRRAPCSSKSRTSTAPSSSTTAATVQRSLDWTDDFEATLEWYLDAAVDTWYTSWEPGGDNWDNNDYFAVYPNGSVYTERYPYPGGWTLLWEGLTSFSAMTDLNNRFEGTYMDIVEVVSY